MGNCCSRFRSSETVNPSHHVSTQSSPPLMEPSPPTPGDLVHPSPSMESCLPTSQNPVISPPMNPSLSISGDPVLPPCSPIPMEPSLPTSGDPVQSPPPVVPSLPSSEDPVHPSLSMERFLPTSGDPGLSSPRIDAIKSIRGIYEKIDPVGLIDPLVSFIQNQLDKMNTPPSGAGSSSSEGWLATVREGIQHAAATVDTISKEAEKVSESDAVIEIGKITLKVLEGMEQLHQVFIGLSLAAFASDRYASALSPEDECKELLLKILGLAKNVRQLSDEKEKVQDAVVAIVESAVIACDYLDGGVVFRFWSAKTAAAQLERTNQQLRRVTDSLALCSLKRQWDKQVFLSLSGKQKDFVRQLHLDLTREHVSCFFDEDRNSLPLAQRFPPLIIKAAEECKIAVLVLSKEFLCSKWPMLELSAFIKAIKSGKNPNLKLLPIFFMISPRELSLPTKDSPEWQNLKVGSDTRREWEDALNFVRSINGLRLEYGNEVALRDEVTKKIGHLLQGTNRRPHLLDFQPVGIEDQVRDVKELLDMEGAQSALAVIVCGFGGAGKSTVAASAVQSLDWSCTDFKFCWVAIDEGTPDKTSHIIKLQKDIINDLEGVKLDLRNPLEGRVRIKEALEKKRSLLFIDNVVDKDYVRDLLPEDLPKQETKLRIIITSRETNVKAELKILCKEYQVKSLSNEASKSLLLETILQSSLIRDEEEEGMMNEVATACKGVPLLVSVFGKHLRVARDERSYQKESYQEVLEALREGTLDSYRDEDLGTRLMFVYDKIKNVEVKEAFLDICTYFHGWQWDLVGDIVEFAILEDLRRRTLMSKSSSGKVIVHDVLRSMGIRKANLNRFSNYEQFSVALKGDLDGFDLKDMKGIWLPTYDTNLITIESTKFEAMSQSLRVLMLGDWVTFEGRPSQKALKNLRYLSVGDITAFPFKDLSELKKLRVFKNGSELGMGLSSLPSSVIRVSHEVPVMERNEVVKLSFQNLNSSLKEFIVQIRRSPMATASVVELPEELHLPASLLHLTLRFCKNLPKDIGHLTNLESLILDRSDLERLPRGICRLKKLKLLTMNRSKLAILPDELGTLSSLETLRMDYCSKLAFLPNELGLLSSLKTLSMNYCSKLAFLPNELCMLSSLETLSMNDCRDLRTLPDSLGGLLSLKNINFRQLMKLQKLPESFGKLCIQSLNLHLLFSLKELPNSFRNLNLLEHLTIESCHSLVSLPDTFVQLKMLKTLNIIDCSELNLLPGDFGALTCLESMTVEGCHLLKELPHGFEALPALKTFKLENCKSLVNISSDFGKLKSLENLSLLRLPLISRIPDGFGKLKKLRFLTVEYCSQLMTLSDDFENIATLKKLTVWNCPKLDGAMMEKILKLPNCYRADISYSDKLLEKWEHMQGETEHPIVVVAHAYPSSRRMDRYKSFEEEKQRAIRVALLQGKCMEVNNCTDQLMERSSLLVGLEEGTTATVALIMLRINSHSHEHHTLQRFVEKAEETAETNGSGKLQIVFARKVDLCRERPTPTEEEQRAEEENGIREILQRLPEGSCAIPSSECKRVKVLTYCVGEHTHASKLVLFQANVGVDSQGRKIFEILKFTEEDEISERHYNSIRNSRQEENKDCSSIQNLIKSIIPNDEDDEQSECVVGESKIREFTEALKANGIHYLLTDYGRNKVHHTIHISTKKFHIRGI